MLCVFLPATGMLCWTWPWNLSLQCKGWHWLHSLQWLRRQSFWQLSVQLKHSWQTISMDGCCYNREQYCIKHIFPFCQHFLTTCASTLGMNFAQKRKPDKRAKCDDGWLWHENKSKDMYTETRMNKHVARMSFHSAGFVYNLLSDNLANV